MLAHVCACIFAFIGRFDDKLHMSWFSAYDFIKQVLAISILQHCILRRFNYNVGYGDIVPVNSTERAFVLMLMVVGSGYYGYRCCFYGGDD